MTVLLVVAMFATIIFVEYLLSRGKEPAIETVRQPSRTPRPTLIPAFVGGFAMAENVRYHPGHTWALSESPDLVRVGMDDFAGRLVGRIDKFTLPKAGTWVRQGQPVLRVRRDDKSASLVSPMEGVVVDVNPALATDPDLARRDPYGEGWLIKIQAPDAPTGFRNLISGAVARSWMEQAARRLHALVPAPIPALAQDGGVMVEDLNALLGEQWVPAMKELFLSD
jgi:glycine cleavage system H lipoate-binding protein